MCTCVFVCMGERERAREEQQKQMIRMKGSCGMRGCVPHVCGVCVCDTGGAMATNFLPEEVINAPAWLWLCLFLSSNDCHTAIMASKKPRNNGRIMAEAIAALHRLNSHIDELCGGVSQQHLCFHKQGWKGFGVWRGGRLLWKIKNRSSFSPEGVHLCWVTGGERGPWCGTEISRPSFRELSKENLEGEMKPKCPLDSVLR